MGYEVVIVSKRRVDYTVENKVMVELKSFQAW
jgi:hypothetical protein